MSVHCIVSYIVLCLLLSSSLWFHFFFFFFYKPKCGLCFCHFKTEVIKKNRIQRDDLEIHRHWEVDRHCLSHNYHLHTWGFVYKALTFCLVINGKSTGRWAYVNITKYSTHMAEGTNTSYITEYSNAVSTKTILCFDCMQHLVFFGTVLTVKMLISFN